MNKITMRNPAGVVSTKTLRKQNLPYLLIWILYYAWVIVFTTWWTASPETGSAFSVESRNIIHTMNLVSSAACIFLFKKEWFVLTARIGAASVLVTLGLFLIAPAPQTKMAAAALLGVSMGCVNISILIPFTFVLNNTEKICAVVCSHLLSNIVAVLIRGFHFTGAGDGYAAAGMLFMALPAVVFFQRKHLSSTAADKLKDRSNVRAAMILTILIGILGAILFLGAGKAMLNIQTSFSAPLVEIWYYSGGVVGSVLMALLFAVLNKNMHMLLSVPFGCLAAGLVCNAFAGRAPDMDIVFGFLLGVGTAMGMSNVYYILGVVSKKYNSMRYLRLSILMIGICGGVSGVWIGNVIGQANTAQLSIISSLVSLLAVIVVLICSPMIAKTFFDDNWARDSTRNEITELAEVVSRVEQKDRFEGLRLSPREKQVAIHLLRGMTMRQIAAELGIAESTVNGYCGTLYKKMQINSRIELFARFGASRNEEET